MFRKEIQLLQTISGLKVHVSGPRQLTLEFKHRNTELTSPEESLSLEMTLTFNTGCHGDLRLSDVKVCFFHPYEYLFLFPLSKMPLKSSSRHFDVTFLNDLLNFLLLGYLTSYFYGKRCRNTETELYNDQNRAVASRKKIVCQLSNIGVLGILLAVMKSK